MKTALLIEDDAEARQLIVTLLREHGWMVLEAEDGETGIQLARQHRPTVVVCDLLMPRCNGFQVIRALRSDKEQRRCRIIVTSGRDYAVDRFNALEAGADEYVTKPFRMELLLDLMAKGANHEIPRPSPPPPISSQASGRSYFRFWGVRGSVPTPGQETVFYGGNTSCVEVRADGEIIILDAGTGIRGLGHALAKEFPELPIHVSLLITHTHWDHIQGFPFFAPVYGKGNLVRVYGFEGARDGLAKILLSQMESPYFPVGIRELPGTVSIEELKAMQFRIGEVRVECSYVNHPGICVGYRLETSRGSLAFLPDNEPYLSNPPYIPEGKDEQETLAYAAAQDARLVNFLRGVDHLILDSQYDADEYTAHRGWGHGSLDEVVALALRAKARHLHLFHHDPSHDDSKISRMVADARQLAAASSSSLKVEAAREGQVIPLDLATPLSHLSF